MRKVDRIIVLDHGKIIEEEDLSIRTTVTLSSMQNRTMEQIEKGEILARLKSFTGDRKRTAKSLGISLRTLQYRLSKWEKDEKGR